jgi:hypothetical protein
MSTAPHRTVRAVFPHTALQIGIGIFCHISTVEKTIFLIYENENIFLDSIGYIIYNKYVSYEDGRGMFARRSI